MSLRFVYGASGSGKTNYIFNDVIEKSKDLSSDYIMIVPEQFTMQTQRMLVDLAPGKAIMNIDVLSFKRLAYRVFDDLGIKTEEILEETGKNLVLRKIAIDKQDKLTVFRPNMRKIGYISEIKSLLSELEQYNISPEQLKGYIESGKIQGVLKAKLSDVLTLYEGFQEYMNGKYITATNGKIVKRSQAAEIRKGLHGMTGAANQKNWWNGKAHGSGFVIVKGNKK